MLSGQAVPYTNELISQVNATCSAAERSKGAASYAQMVSQYSQTVAGNQVEFQSRFPFYTNSTFAGDAFATATQLLAYGNNVLSQMKQEQVK